MKPSEIGKVLRIMECEARKRSAPVFQVENVKTTPFKTLIFTMLSARTKDTTSIPIVRKLFVQADRPGKMLQIPEKKLASMLYGIGFYRTKAKNIHRISHMLIEKWNGHVPGTLEELTMLPGVGKKTANIVLNIAFGKPVIGVDTHVHRISNRLGLVRTKTPEQTENVLERLVPDRYKVRFNKILVAYGQTICVPVSPFCSVCKLRERYCPRIGVKKCR